METATMRKAVEEATEVLISEGRVFSAHTVTQVLRGGVNNQKLEIDGIDEEQVLLKDGKTIDTQPIEHQEVRVLVKDVMQNNSRGYTSSMVDGFIAYHGTGKTDAEIREAFDLPPAPVVTDDDNDDDSTTSDDQGGDDDSSSTGLTKKFS